MSEVQVTPGVVFKPNPDFMEELVAEPGVIATREEFAQRAAVFARAIGAAIADTGAYAASIHVEGARLISDDPGAAYIEFGSVNNPPFAPLRRGADSTGVLLSDRGQGEPEDGGRPG